MRRWRIVGTGGDRLGTPYVIYDRRKGLSFSGTEIKHIVLSILVLTVAFTIFSMGSLEGFLFLSQEELLLLFMFSFIIVITSFLLHELAHKIVAQRYGCWAEYRYTPLGLLLTLLTAFMGFLFAAPGAVYFSGFTTKEETGKIKAAGPVTNLLVAAGMGFIFLFLLHFPLHHWTPYGWRLTLGGYFILLNLFVGGFNMIPIDPFDGGGVLRWNAGAYVAIFAALIGCGILFFYLIPTYFPAIPPLKV